MAENFIQQLTDKEFAIIRELIYRRAGIALSDAKQALVNARLRRRLVHHGFTSFSQYLDLLRGLEQEDPEFTHFVNCITTNLTGFFREPHHFEFVAKSLIPGLIEDVERGRAMRKLRFWHAGCSTGEEAYTLAMTVCEALPQYRSWDIRSLASDIDTRVLGHAERAQYDEERASKVPPHLRGKFFHRSASGAYVVAPQLRELISFRQINLLQEPWPIRSDVRFNAIFCRNVMIYFDKQTQKRLLDRFVGLLAPGGHLFLGHSENTLGLTDAIVPVGQTIYRLPESRLGGAA